MKRGHTASPIWSILNMGKKKNLNLEGYKFERELDIQIFQTLTLSLLKTTVNPLLK